MREPQIANKLKRILQISELYYAQPGSPPVGSQSSITSIIAWFGNPDSVTGKIDTFGVRCTENDAANIIQMIIEYNVGMNTDK